MRHDFSLPRHRHLLAYATVVLAGTLGEAGYAGRIEAKAGDVLIHPRLDCHVNQKVCAGVRLVRLPWSNPVFESGLYHIDDLDYLAVTAEKSPADATFLLGELLQKCAAKSPRVRNDWPDLLATDLVTDVGVKSWRLGPRSPARTGDGFTGLLFSIRCLARGVQSGISCAFGMASDCRWER